MPTDPYVAPTLDDLPRQEPNLAPGVRLPAAKSWVADRPGDLSTGQPAGELLGRPGPNIGYAVTLAERAHTQWVLAPHESPDDAVAVVSELAMKRAASFGRAPVVHDVQAAASLLGYVGEVDPEFARWRARTVHGAAHEYEVRRRIVDAVADGVLRRPPRVAGMLVELRAELRRVLDAAG